MTIKTFFSPWVMAAFVAIACVFILPKNLATTKDEWPPVPYAEVTEIPHLRNPYAARQFRSVDHREIQCMADAIYQEAGRESVLGKAAVARVIVNRVRHPEFPKTVCGVVHQRTNGVCQFSYLCVGRVPKDPALFAKSYNVAVEVLTQDQYKNLLPNALFYHANYVNPGWNLRRVKTIGTHIFYTTKGQT